METRKYEIEEIRKRRKKAKTSWERRLLDKVEEKIFRENTPEVEKLTKQLIKATRNKDYRAVNYFTNKLLKYRKYG